jgi:putative peptidoglycan lipid II flippase
MTPVMGKEMEGRNATLVTLGILLSRILGLLRERAFGYFFGASLYADAWRAASRLPNILQNLLGEGVLSASFIPIYASLREKGLEEDARRFAGALFGLLVAVASVVALIGVLLAPWLVLILFPGFEGEQAVRTAALVRIFFPMTAVLVLSAWTLGVLNTHGRFFLSYAAPALWNVAILGAMALGGWWMGLEGDALLQGVALGALVGGVLQFGVQLPTALRLLQGFRPSLALGAAGVREALARSGPVFLGRGITNLSSWLDFFLASFLAVGALAVLGYAQILYLLPVALFGSAVAASELPEMARNQSRGEAGDGARAEGLNEADRLRAGGVRILYPILLVSSLYWALGDTVVAALFQTGAFGAEEVRLTWAVLAVYTAGIGVSALSRLYQNTLWARGDTRRPALFAGIRAGISLVVGALLMLPFDALAVAGEGTLRYGAVGLALGSALGAWVEWGLYRRTLRGSLPSLASSLTRLLPLIGAGGAAVLGGWGGREFLRGLIPGLHPIPEGVLVLGLAGLLYLGVARLQGVSPPFNLPGLGGGGRPS